MQIRVRHGAVTREEWLQHAVARLRGPLALAGGVVPRTIHVSVGFGGNTARAGARAAAVCYRTAASTDASNHVFISPLLDDPVEILESLAHELIHSSDDCASGHRGHFAKVARRFGFLPPMRATPCSDDLHHELAVMADQLGWELGRYPHARMAFWPADNPT